MSKLNLADLVDLEWLLRGDGKSDKTELDAERTRAIGRKICMARGVDLRSARTRLDTDRELAAALCAGWLDAIRARHRALPGRRVAIALDVTGWILVLVGLASGGSAATALLAYDGTVPVNVVYYSAFFFGLQILLLAMTAWFIVRAGSRRSTVGPRVLHRGIAFLALALLGRNREHAIAALRTSAARRLFHADLERWTLFALAQRFGVAFNVGALFFSLSLIVFSDLVFAWSTTIELSAVEVHKIFRSLAFPWWWLPEAVPSFEVVQSSQWVRMQETFVGGKPLAEAIPLAGQWWRFLLAGLIVWGLVPRVIALALGTWRARRARRAMTLDHAGYQALYDRLLPPSVEWVSPAPETVRGPAPKPSKQSAKGRVPATAGAPTWVVAWGSLGRLAERVAGQIGRRFGADVRASLAAGGADLAADKAVVEELRHAAATRIALVFSAGQQPTAEVLSFLQSVRGAIGPGRPIVTVLVDERADGTYADAEPDEREAFGSTLVSLDDPHLWMETMEVST